MNYILQQLEGGDLRSIGKTNSIVKQIKTQEQFNLLFEGLLNNDRLIAMRAVDAIEKITQTKKKFLVKHKTSILKLLANTNHIEFKWHIALLVSRLTLNDSELNSVWNILAKWAIDKSESKIVRVNALQSLFNLAQIHTAQQPALKQIIYQLKQENIPSINARIRKLFDIN